MIIIGMTQFLFDLFLIICLEVFAKADVITVVALIAVSIIKNMYLTAALYINQEEVKDIKEKLNCKK